MIIDPGLKIRIRTELMSRSMTIADLCRRLKIPYGTMAHWINGLGRAPDNFIPRIEITLGLQAGAMGGSTEPDVPSANKGYTFTAIT